MGHRESTRWEALLYLNDAFLHHDLIRLFPPFTDICKSGEVESLTYSARNLTIVSGAGGVNL